MQAILPLAGKGTRLRPLTHTRPKPLLRVANRPVLSYVVEQLESVGVDEVICITGHLAGQIEEFLAAEYPSLGVHYVEQVTQLGTADAVRLAEPFVHGPTLIVFVDTLFDADLDLIASRADADGIIWAQEVEDYQRFGVIVTDEGGFMRRIVEKPSQPISRLANIGVQYVREPEALFEGVRHVMDQPTRLGEYFLTDVFQYMVDRGARLLTAEVEGWWDCGKPETLLATNREMVRRGAGSVPAGADVAVDGPVCVAADVRLEGVQLGPNVSIGAGAVVRHSRLENCIVGEHSVLEGCDLRDSLVGDRVRARGVSGRVLLGDDCEADAGGSA